MPKTDSKPTFSSKGQKAFLKNLEEPAKSILATYMLTTKSLMFHYLRWLEERLETEVLETPEVEHTREVMATIRCCYDRWLPGKAEERWAAKYVAHMEAEPTQEGVWEKMQSVARALRSIPSPDREAFIGLYHDLWRCAAESADDPLWLLEFSGEELIELNFFHRLIVLADRYVNGQLTDEGFEQAAFSYAQRPLRRDHFYLTDNSLPTLRLALSHLNFRMSETLMLILRDFTDYLEKFTDEERLAFREESRRNLSPEVYAYTQLTLKNVKILVDESRAEHPGSAQKRLESLRYVVNFPAVLNALRKRAIYGHSLVYAFPFTTTLQVLYHCAGKIGAPEDSIFFDFTRLILNPNVDRCMHKRSVMQPAFQGTRSIDPLQIN